MSEPKSRPIRFRCPRCDEPTTSLRKNCRSCRRIERDRLRTKRADPIYRAAENLKTKIRVRRLRARRREAQAALLQQQGPRP